MNDIAVIVVNWNAKDDLRACLQSLARMSGTAVSFETWVVDNASTDGSPDMVRAEFPDVHLLVNQANLGFSRANNQAIALSQSRYVFLLNSDAFVHPHALTELMAYADAHPRAGIVGPRVLNPNGTLQYSCRRFPTLGAGVFRNTYLGRLFPRNKYAQDYLMADFDHQSVRTVDWVSGCAMFIRRALIDDIGALDERFFMYCEDVDLCLRAGQAYAPVVYVPQALVTHAIGRSSDKAADRMIWEFHRAWFEFDKKRHPHASALRKAAVWGGLWLRANVRIAKRRLFARRQQHAQEMNTANEQAGLARSEGQTPL